jgi:hypothetical protein
LVFCCTIAAAARSVTFFAAGRRPFPAFSRPHFRFDADILEGAERVARWVLHIYAQRDESFGELRSMAKEHANDRAV